MQKPFDDAQALAKLAADSDVITYEFENVPVAALQELGETVPIYPPLQALRQAQDRLDEKRLFERLKIPLPAYRAVDSSTDLVAAAESLGLPLVLKTRRLGYDGKGQCVIHSASDIEAAWHALGGSALIAEQWVPFDYEVSSIGVRSSGGETGIYALSQNTHVNGILRTTQSPVEAPRLIAKAEKYMRLLLTELDYVGVLALELFVKDDQLLANEFAPRVHNSGHWTIEGADTSQFENHLRAIMGLPLGSTRSRGYAGMIEPDRPRFPPGCSRSATAAICTIMAKPPGSAASSVILP